MPIGVTVEIPGMTADIYQQVMANMNWGVDDDPQGFIAHYACEKPGRTLRVRHLGERGGLAGVRRGQARRRDRRRDRRWRCPT